MILVTTGEMQEMDRQTIDSHGIPGLELMENAGKGATRALLDQFPDRVRTGVGIICGKGNNGGDGFVMARYLADQNIDVTVYLLGRSGSVKGDAAKNLAHLDPLGRLAAYAARSGKELWHVDLQSRFQARYGIWAFAENVTVEGNKVICMPGGAQGRVVALDKHTGKTLWANTEIQHGAAYCSPIVVTHAGKRQWISLTQRSVVGVAVDTGKLLWSAPFVPMSPQNSLTPVFKDGYVFVACGHSSGGTLFKIDLSRRTASVAWERVDLDDCHSGAFVLDGRLYGCACRSGGRHFFCVDYLTGRIIKQDQSLGKVGMTCAAGMIYCLGHRGTLSLLGITPDGFSLLSQFELPRKPANSYLAHPVICGGRLYIRCDQNLYAYDVGSH